MKCCWLMSVNHTDEKGVFQPAVQCGAKTRYKYVLDDDKNKVREYIPYCDEHLKMYHEKGADLDDQYNYYDEDLGK